MEKREFLLVKSACAHRQIAGICRYVHVYDGFGREQTHHLICLERLNATGRDGEIVSHSIQKLVILHTNDIHSHFEQMPKIAQIVKSYRAMCGEDELLVLDCGDHMDRAFVETEGSDGKANIEVMNATGYDLAVPGNNEGLTFSIETLQKLYGELARFPVIGSNMKLRSSEDIPSWLNRYLIITKNSLKIGVIGVTIDYTDFYELLGWDIRNPFDTVRELVAQIRHEVDILMVVSHLGITADEQMAKTIPGIDVIFGAHTHHLFMEPVRIGRTVLCAAGKFGEYVGKLELGYDHSSKQIVSVTGTCIRTEPEDQPEIRALIQRQRGISEQNLRQVVAKIDDRLEVDWYRESRLGNLLADALREWCDAEIGLVNSGQLLESIEAGEVTREQLLRICPSPINACRMTLFGWEIRDVLEQSLLRDYQAKPIRGYGFRGVVLGMLAVSGLEVEVNPSRPGMHKIERILLNGEELADDREVTVGTIDMFTFGKIGYDRLSDGRNIRYFVPEFLRDILLCSLNDPKQIAASARKHWFFQPSQ